CARPAAPRASRSCAGPPPRPPPARPRVPRRAPRRSPRAGMHGSSSPPSAPGPSPHARGGTIDRSGYDRCVMETDARRNAAAMMVFAEVVASGSFTRAARRLGLSKASVSREVARLERRLGAQLLRRTTRSMSLTESGEVFCAGCQRVVEEAAQAERSVGELQAEPRGEIRLAASVSFGQLQIAPRLPAFLARHPHVRVRMDLTDRMVDLVGEKFDLALRIAGGLSDATLTRRRLCPIRFVVCAAPAYLERHPPIRTPAQLEKHN